MTTQNANLEAAEVALAQALELVAIARKHITNAMYSHPGTLCETALLIHEAETAIEEALTEGRYFIGGV